MKVTQDQALNALHASDKRLASEYICEAGAEIARLKRENVRLGILFDDIYVAWMAGNGDEVDRLLHTEVKPAAQPTSGERDND